MYTKTATRKQFVKRCEQLGMKQFDDSDTIKLDAPAGFVLRGTGLHWIDMYYGDGAWKKGEIYSALIYDMEMGIEECDDWDCEICTEAGARGDVFQFGSGI